MNDNNVQQIFAHYIEKFEYINSPKCKEYYKWQIANRFHGMMDEALAASAEDFPAKLYGVKKLSANLIDNYTQPFYGLVKFAQREPETVKAMFKALYADDGGDIAKRMERVQTFIAQSNALRDKYYPDSYLYTHSVHSVTGYLFLYDPDHNYIYKPNQSLAFADCVEFYDDWGYGTNVKLPVYYRMCDQLVEAIKGSKELLATDASRFENGWGEDASTIYPDTEKHILAFDLIYCCSVYNLFDGIRFTRPKTKDRQLMQERKDKAATLSRNLEKARQDVKELQEALKYINSIYVPGLTIEHKKYGDIPIIEKDGYTITVDVPDTGKKKLDIRALVANGIVTADVEGYAAMAEKYQQCLKDRDNIEPRLARAEQEFAPYVQYL